MAIIEADLAQIEWRTAAALSRDPTMIKEITSGIDQHGAACVDLMELPLTKENRYDAKIFNFRMIYGGSDYSFYMDNKMPNFSLKKWKRIVNGFYSKYSGLAEWHDQLMRDVYANHGIISIPSGRFFKFEKRMKGGAMVYHKPQVVNYPVQGFAQDIIKLAMIYVMKELSKYPEIKLVMQVHDSLIFDCPKKYVDFVAKTCYNIFVGIPNLIQKHFNFDLMVPITGDIEVSDESWGTVKKYQLDI